MSAAICEELGDSQFGDESGEQNSDNVNNSGLIKKSFDSYMVLEEDLSIGQHRLLETDNKLYLPS